MKNVLLLVLLSLSIATFATNSPKQNSIKVALLLDTSNSMDGLINQAKAQLWEIVNELSKMKCNEENPNLQIALYEYGNSDISVLKGYIRQVTDFSNDLDLISEKLFSLDTNGGHEYCGEVIMTSLKDLKWGNNKNDLKLIFIAGNEPFTQGEVNYKDAATQANEQDVTVNTIFCGDYNSGISGKWKAGADLTGGDYMVINHNDRIVHIATPYDDIIIKLNRQLNDTYIYYGKEGSNKRMLQRKQDENAAEMDEVVIVKRAVSKSGRLYNNASWDLVDAENDKGFSYKSLDKKSLPKELQNKSTEEIKTYVAEQRKKRADIKKAIQSYNKKRDAYVAKQHIKNANKNSLENVLLKTVRKQAKAKNYEW
ncbi:MAG: hypothetical protein CSA39_04230 [Flavobacteriales bacterium]|nr:MAG: hypothetical protein CSA39_04230 [Flavobacteriales bacterium]